MATDGTIRPGSIRHSDATELFLVRLWVTADGEGNVSWHGKAQHVVTGEAQVFDDWPALIALFLASLSRALSGPESHA